MKFKKFGLFYTLVFTLIVLALAGGGCGGSSSNSTNNTKSKLTNGDYSQLLVVSSKVFKDGNEYSIYRGGTLYNGSTEYTNKYYVAQPDSANDTVTIKLGLYEALGNDLLTIKDANNNIVYAYNPSGTTSDTTNYPSSLTLSGNYSELEYNSLSLGSKTTASSTALTAAENNSEQNLNTAENSYQTAADTIKIALSGTSATVGGTAAKNYDYVWHASPSVSVDYYTDGTSGTTMMSESDVLAKIAADGNTVYNTYGVYIARDVHYMPNNLSFTHSVKNDNETEYACYYDSSVVTEAKAANPSVTYSGNMIFATMPTANSSSTMTSSASDAYSNPVLHITKPGTYELSGTWNGQIWIDASTASKPAEDTNAKVTLILNGVTVTCGVAPALVFHNVYEVGPDDEDEVAASSAFLTLGKNKVTSSAAGAVVQIASGTTNNFTGKNLYRILSINPKSSVTTINGTDIDMQKKRWKIDGAFYSFVSMVIEGSGTLNVTSTTYEGLDAEMHLSINGGTITVNAPDDGINVNEDDVSVFTMNGGTLTVSSTGGDGIDSNGYIVINGGTLTSKSGGGADHGLDSDKGVYIATSGATVYTDGVENQKTTTGYTGTYTTIQGNGNNNGQQPGGTPPDQNQNGNNPPDQNEPTSPEQTQPNDDETQPDNNTDNSDTSDQAITIDSSGSTLVVDADVSSVAKDTNSVSTRIAYGVDTDGDDFKIWGTVNTFSGIVADDDD